MNKRQKKKQYRCVKPPMRYRLPPYRAVTGPTHEWMQLLFGLSRMVRFVPPPPPEDLPQDIPTLTLVESAGYRFWTHRPGNGLTPMLPRIHPKS